MAVDYQESWLSVSLLERRGTRHLGTFQEVQGWMEGEWTPRVPFTGRGSVQQHQRES